MDNCVALSRQRTLLVCHPCLDRPAPRDLWVIPLPHWNPRRASRLSSPLPSVHVVQSGSYLLREIAPLGAGQGGSVRSAGGRNTCRHTSLWKPNLQATLLNCGLVILLQCLSGANYWRSSSSIITSHSLFVLFLIPSHFWQSFNLIHLHTYLYCEVSMKGKDHVVFSPAIISSREFFLFLQAVHLETGLKACFFSL